MRSCSSPDFLEANLPNIEDLSQALAIGFSLRGFKAFKGRLGRKPGKMVGP